MEKSKLLREIANAMVEFKLEKELNTPLIGSNISLFYKHPETKRELSILSEFAIDDLTQNLLDITFEFAVVIPIETKLYELFYGQHCTPNTISRYVYLDGDWFVKKIELLMQTTNINASNATKVLLETIHGESIVKAFDALTNIKRYADENMDS